MGTSLIDGQDNDSYAFRTYPKLNQYQRIHQELVPDLSGPSRLEVHRCESCSELTSKWDEPLLGLVIKKRRWDLSITYDGVLIASQRFKTMYDANDLSGLVFHSLPDDHDFFAIRAVKVVEFDADRRQTRFINPCPRCGRFESVVGATPVFLKAGSLVEALEFVRTDLEFGSGDEKHPLLICGPTAAETLADAKLKGLDLSRIK
jgi:hypothetical protein